MSRVVTRCSSAAASLPVIMYLISGVTSISAAALRIAQYSRSSTCSYEPATKYPAHLRQLRGWHRAEVRSWKGVVLSWSMDLPGSCYSNETILISLAFKIQLPHQSTQGRTHHGFLNHLISGWL